MAPNRPFNVDPVLTAITIGYSNPAQAMIADAVMPRHPVSQEVFKWTEYLKEQFFGTPDDRVGRRGQVNQVTFEGKERESSIEDFGLDSPIPISDIEAASRARAEGRSTYDPEETAVMGLTSYLQNNRESRVAKMVQDSNNYDADRRITLAGGDRLFDYDNSKPIEVLRDLINSTFIFRANTLVMGHADWQVLSMHPHIVNAIRGNLTDKGIVRREELAALLEVKDILVGEGYMNVARPGQAADMQRAWGGSIQALYIDPVASTQMGVTFGMTAELGNRISGRIEDEDVGLQGGTRIRVGQRLKELIIASDVGAHLTGTSE